MTVCSMCNGKGRIDTLENELCAFCGGTGKYSQHQDNEAIAILDSASVEKDINAGDIARIADVRRMAKKTD